VSAGGWEEATALLRGVFGRAVAEPESTLCLCAVCQHLHELKLKIIVHSGEALFHTIGDFADVSGVDVIFAHQVAEELG